MVLPRRLARFNKRVLNRVLGQVAPVLPLFALLHHRGRRSGRRYAVPINVFVRGDRYVFALTYGSGTDWLRNVEAAGRCVLITRGRVVPLRSPRVYHDASRADMPLPVRLVLGLVGVAEFLEMSRAIPGPGPSSSAVSGWRSPPGSR